MQPVTLDFGISGQSTSVGLYRVFVDKTENSQRFHVSVSNGRRINVVYLLRLVKYFSIYKLVFKPSM